MNHHQHPPSSGRRSTGSGGASVVYVPRRNTSRQEYVTSSGSVMPQTVMSPAFGASAAPTPSFFDFQTPVQTPKPMGGLSRPLPMIPAGTASQMSIPFSPITRMDPVSPVSHGFIAVDQTGQGFFMFKGHFAGTILSHKRRRITQSHHLGDASR